MVAIPDFFTHLYADNQYFSAGTGLAVLGAGLGVLKQGYSVGQMIFRRRCMISMELNSNDYAYQWVLNWINSQPRIFAKATADGARNYATQHVSINTNFTKTDAGRSRTDFRMVPSPGDHYISYNHWPIKVDRTREKAMTDKPFETVTLTTFGWTPAFFEEMLAEAQVMNDAALEQGIVIYETFGHEWRPFGHPRRKRPISSVVMEPGQAERLTSDINEFIDSSEWYKNRGVPYRRGYLLYGPPGCGKTCFIYALASELGYNICNLSLSERTLTDDRLCHLLNNAPQQSIIVLEDVDAAFVSREPRNEIEAARYQGLPHLTFSGVLNAIDGVASGDGRILFMTTNYPDRLDAALVRPGRADVKEKVDYSTDCQLKRLFQIFYPDPHGQLLADKFVRLLRTKYPEKPISPAMVQNYFLVNKDDPQRAVDSLDSFMKYK